MLTTQPIVFAECETLSFRQIDQLNGLSKGATFRIFKRYRQELLEDHDYFYLPATSHEALIQSLKASEQVYRSTNNLVLFTRSGYSKLQGLATLKR